MRWEADGGREGWARELERLKRPGAVVVLVGGGSYSLVCGGPQRLKMGRGTAPPSLPPLESQWRGAEHGASTWRGGTLVGLPTR
eukprot:scaffold319780_cov30-Tisochrysis_lutea.AAC.1